LAFISIKLDYSNHILSDFDAAQNYFYFTTGFEVPGMASLANGALAELDIVCALAGCDEDTVVASAGCDEDILGTGTDVGGVA